MGFGYGPGADMMKSVKEQKSHKVKRSLKDSTDMTMHGKNGSKALRFASSTPEQIEEIRKQMQAETKRNQKVALIISLIILLAITYFAFF